MNSVTTMKDAIKEWERANGKRIVTASEVKLNGILPPLDKMDNMLMTFVRCEKLSLSSNCIERINNLNGMKHLKILSLGRNNIKSIAGIEAVGETLEELWISYNQIEKLKGIFCMKKLRVLCISNNLIREWSELIRLSELPTLKELGFVGNPLEERLTNDGTWRLDVCRRFPNLTKLDGCPIVAGQFVELWNNTDEQEDKPTDEQQPTEDEPSGNESTSKHQPSVEDEQQSQPKTQETM